MLGIAAAATDHWAACRSPVPTGRRSRPTSAASGTTTPTKVRRLRRQRRLHGRRSRPTPPELRHRRRARRRSPSRSPPPPPSRPPVAALTRPPGSSLTNTVKLPIDLNPGALATDAFVGASTWRPIRTARCRARPRSCSPTRRRGPSTCGSTRGRAPMWSRLAPRASPGRRNPQAFSPWATPAAIRAFAPFDLKSFRWTDSRGPSYRFNATITETSATGGEHRHRAREEGQVQVLRHREDPQSRVLQALPAQHAASGGSASSTRATRRWPAGSRSGRSRSRGDVFFRGATFRSSAVG